LIFAAVTLAAAAALIVIALVEIHNREPANGFVPPAPTAAAVHR
jgi:hypothetical protein